MQPQHRNETDLHSQNNSNNIVPTTKTTTNTINSQENGGVPNLNKKLQNGGHHNANTAATANNTVPATNTTNGHMNGYQNGLRRDSTQAWTPLLANGNGIQAIEQTNGVNGKSNGDVVVGNGGLKSPTTPITNTPLDDTTTLLYNGANTNNNDLKTNEDIKNLKNGLLHMSPHHTHPHAHTQGNNNGSMMNGKNGHGLTDKYANEQDPLTGLYRQRSSESEDSDFDSDLQANDSKQPSCGLFGCRPSWASRFASTHVFMLVFLLAYILQGMYMTYFVSVITTIEKLFQIKSKTTGFLLSASEMGQISTAMLLTYFAGRGHRPRWIACGMVLFSIAAFACALPHFIFGDQLIQSNALLRTPAQLKFGNAAMDAALLETSAGGFGSNASDGALLSAYSMHDMNLCRIGDNATASSNECNEDRKMEQASHSKITVIVLCIFFASLLSSGIGQTAVATLGIPYIDDNVASKQSPMYMAITIGVRILGPASGFIVGSFCTRWYVNFTNPGFDPTDPRWIGAWWLGPVIIGSLMLLASIAMFSFPKQLRGKRSDGNANGGGEQHDANAGNALANAEPEEKPKLKDFPKTVRRQLSNDILMFRTASCVFHLLPIAGLYTFLPKYLETQFRLQTYDANMVAAFCGILVMGVGIVISGLVILKLKPSARSVAAWIALTALIYSAGMVILMFIGCNMNDFAGYKPTSKYAPASIEPACSAALNCTCDMENFAPICGLDNKIYISACHAGCTASKLRDGDNRTAFADCACITDIDPQFSNENYMAINGYCEVNCKNYIYFILIFVICVFIHSTSEVGSMLLVMRCTHPKDKAMAMGVIQSAIGLFGNVPCPIIYGAVVDSACLLWKSVCGKHGACSLYDADSFRNYFLGITAGIMFLAFIMDLIVFTKAHRIDIAPEEANEAHTNPMDAESASAMATAPDTTV